MLESLNEENQFNIDLLRKDVENRDVMLLTSGIIKQDHKEDTSIVTLKMELEQVKKDN